MRKCIPAFLFLLFIISAVCYTVNGQSPAKIKTANVDSFGEEVIIACSFPDLKPQFPGGIEMWRRLISKNLKYPPAAWKANIQGTVLVIFTIETDGRVTEIEAASGPEELKQAAIDVIKISPKWSPAVERGHNVKRYETQPIVFRLAYK
jgi:protein TonB